jgi:hypothetical protein
MSLRNGSGLAAARRAALWGFALLCACAGLASAPRIATATELVREGYYWYVPEHEQYSRTEFFDQPDFRSGVVRIARTQRFQFVSGHRGWALLQFDSGQQAFIHLRVLRVLLWNPAASDPWYEYKRASVFPEEPEKIEARLKSPRAEPKTADSKVPVWKRYKDGWSVNKGRTPSSTIDSDTEGASAPAPEKKRNKYPLLPPIGSQPQPGNAEQPSQDGTSR